jgi:glucosamine--fructose-6-phosphate aminotransferase (isomerizing)
MTAAQFAADLEAKPAALRALADRLGAGNPFTAVASDGIRRVVFAGMGSSRFAAGVAALELRAAGIDAVAEYASADIGQPPGRDTLVVAISASGESAETLDYVARHAGRSPIVAMTNAPLSSLARAADVVVDMAAGVEASGVACRTFQHTGLLLRSLEARLTGIPEDIATLCRLVALASEDLLRRRREWLPAVLAALDSAAGVFVLAPVERLASAEQSALMVREGPRRPAVACETGDWVHVDVYLARTLDYRALLYAGSRWDEQALEWLTKRRATVVGVGADVPGAAVNVRYTGDDDPDVALHAETLVGELVAASWWNRR